MRILRLLMIIALTTMSLLSQPREGKNKELSISGSYQNYSSGSGSGSTGAFLVSPRLGFFVMNGLELEPELLFMLGSGSDPVYMLNVNVSYNFISTGKGVPFLLLGYGIANTIPYFNVPFTETNFRIDVLNIGGGIKIFLQEDIAVRLEYRFQKFTGQGEMYNYNYSYYTSPQKVDTRINTVQFGFSIFL